MGQADWAAVPVATRDVDGPIFFTAHEWETIEAASARIIPTDHHPGAREAEVVRFIDRMLAGTQFLFAAANGGGFLRMEGREAEAWLDRIEARRARYRDGISRMDALSREWEGTDFIDLDEYSQDVVLEVLSGDERPRPIVLAGRLDADQGAARGGDLPADEDDLEFFPLLLLHVRQGFYSDPVYGGNESRIGWRVIGFDGPRSLAATTDGSFTTRRYMVDGAEWPYDQHPEVLRLARR